MAKVLWDLHEDIEDNAADLMALPRASHVLSRSHANIKTRTGRRKRKSKGVKTKFMISRNLHKVIMAQKGLTVYPAFKAD